MFLINSRQGSFVAANSSVRRNWQPLSQTYGHCIAEFLNESSSDHLGTLTPIYLCWFTVRTTLQEIVRRFSGNLLSLQRLELALALSRSTSPLNGHPDLPKYPDYGTAQDKSYVLANSADSSRLTNYKAGAGISTCCPSPTLFSLSLGPTNPGMIDIAQETLDLR